MNGALLAVLVCAAILASSAPGVPGRRVRRAFADARGAGDAAGSSPGRRSGRWTRKPRPVSMTLFVQQLAALLRGGRTPSPLWGELWLLHVDRLSAEPARERPSGRTPGLAPDSVRMLAAARAAAAQGLPVGAALRQAATAPSADSGVTRWRRSGEPREQRIWVQLAACFDVAEATGSPLAGVLTRFAAQLEAEDDAEAARQTALAGPRATVRLLTWLPFLGLGLCLVLGVDAIAVLRGSPWGAAALTAGLGLTAAGRIWSARLVRTAEKAMP